MLPQNENAIHYVHVYYLIVGYVLWAFPHPKALEYCQYIDPESQQCLCELERSVENSFVDERYKIYSL